MYCILSESHLNWHQKGILHILRSTRSSAQAHIPQYCFSWYAEGSKAGTVLMFMEIFMEVNILCSVLNWRSPSHYIFIRQHNNLFHRAHLLLQACITHIWCACKLCAQLRGEHLCGHAHNYFCVWVNTSLIVSADLISEESIAWSLYVYLLK